MERTFYVVAGTILAAFWGFFAWWTYDDFDEDLTHTTLFWVSVGGTCVGVFVLALGAVAGAVAAGRRDRASRHSTGP